MAIPLIMAGIAAGGAIAKGIRARKLRKRGERLQKKAEQQRTDFEIPEEIMDNLDLAKNEAFGKPALQSYLEEAAQLQQADDLSAVGRYATSSADALAAATAVSSKTAGARMDAAAAGEEVRAQNMKNLYNAGAQLADYKAMAWDVNVNMPYLQRMQFATDMQGAGRAGEDQAINDGISSLMQAASSFGGYGSDGAYQYQNPTGQLFWNKGRKRRANNPWSGPTQVTPRSGQNFRFDTAFE